MFSRPTTTLIFGCIAALSAGTNYVFSSYAPQIVSKLSLSSTQINIIGLSANLGVYLSGVPLGYIIDQRGPRMTLIISGIFLFVGYGGIRAFYDGGEEGIFSIYGVRGMAFAEFLTGVGSSAGLSSAANATAKSFGSKSRGSRMSLVMSCFGLSAFFYSTLAHASFLTGGDPTSNFLLLISVGCAVSMFLGAIFIKTPLASLPLPSSSSSGYRIVSSLEEGISAPRSGTPRPSTPRISAPRVGTPNSFSSMEDRMSSHTISPESSSDEEDRDRLRKNRKDKEIIEHGLHITGMELLRQKDFWILFAIMGCCSGTGLMYINNIGTVVATLEPTGSSPISVAKLQASLVSLLSIFNCIGRLLAGFSSDFFAHHVKDEYKIHRVWWLVPMSSMFVASQLMASVTNSAEGVSGLALPTAMTGLSYGMLFGLTPILSIEFFGITSFSFNNGVLSLAPAVFGNACNLIFGMIYDHHAPKNKLSPPILSIPLLDLDESLSDLVTKGLDSTFMMKKRGGLEELAVDRLCIYGKACFASAFHVTTAMTLLAVVLSIHLARKRSALDHQ